ncbi:hypothetical protein PVAND_014322 [Polypedilum vanderplanki]|uniref:Uncharacterized protein n=1 Tax=Polypedilum vanderplanki TaxID=319348 RepID=A0A9J6CTJ1_POLVA|nr:hypothetical protein PVAND_014322 [Polypedilum vanderplanki]
MGSEKTSLAIKIFDNAFKAELIAQEVCAVHIKTYFLTGKHINEAFHCGQEGCKLDEEKKINVSIDSTMELPQSIDPKCFCFACNRVFHLKCLNYNLETFMDAPRPFLCRECMRSPLNSHALQYYESNSWKVGVNERRRSFFLSESVKAFPYLMGDQASEDEFDDDDIHSFDPLNEKINDSFNQSVSLEAFNAQKKQAEQAVLNHVAYAKKAEAEIAELKRLLEQKQREEDQNARKTWGRSFTPSGFDAESTQRHNNDPQIITADHLFKKLYNSQHQPTKSAKPTRRVSFLTNDIDELNKSLPKLDDPNLSC